MLNLIGAPGLLTRNCSNVTNAKLRAKIVTADVGPFKVTGHSRAVKALAAIFEVVKEKRPDLYKAVKYDGMLCCRAVRLSTILWSNHSWGMAVDMQIGSLDQYGAETCSQGLIDLYPYFHAARWFWGAGFPTRDVMHMEPSDELVREWSARGLLI